MEHNDDDQHLDDDYDGDDCGYLLFVIVVYYSSYCLTLSFFF